MQAGSMQNKEMQTINWVLEYSLDHCLPHMWAANQNAKPNKETLTHHSLTWVWIGEGLVERLEGETQAEKAGQHSHSELKKKQRMSLN